MVKIIISVKLLALAEIGFNFLKLGLLKKYCKLIKKIFLCGQILWFNIKFTIFNYFFKLKIQ